MAAISASDLLNVEFVCHLQAVRNYGDEQLFVDVLC